MTVGSGGTQLLPRLHAGATWPVNPQGMTKETLTPTAEPAMPCPTCARYACRCGEREDPWADVASVLTPWSEAIAANA